MPNSEQPQCSDAPISTCELKQLGAKDAILKEMLCCRCEANKELASSDYRMYLQRVGQYAYLRWRYDKSVISTKLIRDEIEHLSDELRSTIMTINRRAELLNLKYSMCLKVEQTEPYNDS